MCGAAFSAALDSASGSESESASTDIKAKAQEKEATASASEPPERGLSGIMRTAYRRNAKLLEKNPRPIPKRGLSGLVYGAWNRRKGAFLREGLGINDKSPWTKANQ